MFWNPQELLLMMGTEIFKIDASWADKLTKTRVSFLMTPTVLSGYGDINYESESQRRVTRWRRWQLPVEDGGRWQEAGRSSCSVFSLDCPPPHLFPYLQHQSGPEPGSVSTMSCPLNCSVRAVVRRRFPGGSEEGDSDSYCLIIFLEDKRKQKSGKKSI